MPRNRRGLTLLEVLIAMFILLVGIVGALAALPAGVESGTWVVFQDCAIHLAHSKFAEFRRDRINPRVDLLDGSTYLAPPRHEPLNSSGFRDFAAGPGAAYEYFSDIERYEWKVDQAALQNVGMNASNDPEHGSGTDVGLTLVRVVIRLKGTSREFQFMQYMNTYDK